MVKYLTEEEIISYCQLQAGVTMSDVIIASELINSFVGKSFEVKEVSESVKVNAKRRGKLNYYPVVEIIEAKEFVITSIGITKQEVSPTDIYLDIESDGYFTYLGKNSPFAHSFALCDDWNTSRDKKLEIKYKYGYAKIPEDIKMVCAMLAQNIRQMQSFAGISKLSTLDYTVQMANPSFFTDDMRLILNKYR